MQDQNKDNWYRIDNIDQVDTPALAVYPARVKENIRTLVAAVDDVARLRPHVKTHKTTEATLLMLEAGIRKFKCATIAEAEMLAMAGAPDVIDKLKKGYRAIGRTYKNHIDGFNLLPYLTGQVKESPRNLFMYFSDDGDVLGMRYDNWKIVFMEQRLEGTLGFWAEPFVRLRLPKIFNLRTDPYEFAPVTSNSYYDWMLHNAYFIYVAQAAAAKFAETFKEFPAVQKPNTFTIDDAIAKMSEAASSAGH